MDDNLVERLHLNCKCMADTCTMCEAADEIERLRAEVRESARRNVTLFGELQTAVEETNQLRRWLERTYRMAVGHGPNWKVFDGWEEAISAYEEDQGGMRLG